MKKKPLPMLAKVMDYFGIQIREIDEFKREWENMADEDREEIKELVAIELDS